MEIYKRLPDELQRIVKRYAICSPHKQLLLDNTRNYTYRSYGLICFHDDQVTELVEYRRRIDFNCKHGNQPHISRRTLLWYYYEVCSKPILIQFIQHNISTHERNWLCKQQFGRSFTKLNIPQLIWLRLYIYYTI
jgi:hypothetical protein